MKSQPNVFSTFLKWLFMIERQTSLKLKALQRDNSDEYLSTEMKTFMEDQGIVQRLTVSEIPQPNIIAERVDRTLLDIFRSMLYQNGLAKEFGQKH